MRTDTFIVKYCTILFFIGIILYCWIKYREFSRRNIRVGLEGFENYEQLFLIGELERIGKFFSFSLIIISFVIGTIFYIIRDKEIQRNTPIQTEQIENF